MPIHHPDAGADCTAQGDSRPNAANPSERGHRGLETLTFEAITEELANGGKIQLVGFGTFDVRDRAARTGKEVEIAAAKVPAFKAG